MGHQTCCFKKVFLILVWGWTLIIVSFLGNLIWEDYKYIDKLALYEAETSAKKDIAYRKWAASHGGVYVPVTEKTQPNPYLLDLAERDLNTTAGQLTLMNPAYMLSQVMKAYAELHGVKNHITSTKLINPNNKPDVWEAKVLENMEKTGQTFKEKSTIDGKDYIRFMTPLITEKACLKCHEHQGYKVGDVRGALSVSVPLEHYYDDMSEKTLFHITEFFLIWLIGIVAIFSSRKKLYQLFNDKLKAYEQNVYSMVSMIEQRDSYTAGHTERVAKYAVLIAEAMGYEKEKIEQLNRACMLHDIGKISTPDSILLKPGVLSEAEYSIIKEHVVTSYDLLKNIDIYHEIAELIRHHHEHYDGRGYPQGIKGDEIPMLSHIMIVADAFDAMTTNRIYKSRKTVASAIKEIGELAGKQFHPEVAKVAQRALADVSIKKGIAQLPKNSLEQERFSYFYKDQLTNAYNREYLDFILKNNDNKAFKYRHIASVFLKKFNAYNKNHGWQGGDAKLQEIASALQKAFPSSMIFRIFGDDFIILSHQDTKLDTKMDGIKDAIKKSGLEVTLQYFDIIDDNIKNRDILESLLKN